MKKSILVAGSISIFILSFFSFDAKASHAAGGEMAYQWISGNTYRFYFKFYRDCSGSAEPNTVTLCRVNTCTNQSSSMIMTKMTTLPGGLPNGAQVATGCANQKNKCDSLASAIPGYREWWYSADYTLPSACSAWKFSVTVVVRNSSANIVGLPNFYVETILNSADAPGNSSPVFSVKPVPYVCLNQAYNYNNGGVDPDGDSVAFEVMTPLTHNGNCNAAPTNCSYQSASPALSIPSNPFQTNNTFVINAQSGELGFTPGLLGAHTVSVRAKEYRGGVFIGSVMRDIQVQVITCTGTSTTPTIGNDSVSVTGAATYSGGVVSGCATQQFSFCFNIKSTDTAAKLVATDNHNIAMPGSTIIYTNLQNDSVRGCVTWTPTPTDTGNRVFVVTVKDSSCASGGVPINYAITVPVYVFAVTAAIKDTTICAGESVPLNAVGGTGYVWSVISGGAPITSLSCTACKSPIATPSVTTRYVVTSNSSQVCNQNTDTLTVTVKPLPNASASGNSPICPGDTLKLFGNTLSGATYSWSGPNGFTSNVQNPVIPNAQLVNSGFYGLTITKDGCNSETFNIQMYVGPPAGPDASSNSPICLGNQIILTATTVSGSVVTYHWTGPNGFTSNQQNVVRNNATYADSGKYIVYAMKDGCQTFKDSVNIKINPLPIAPVATFDTVKYCQNVVASQLTATGTNLKWYNVPTGGTGSSTLSPSTLVAGSFKYYVSQTDINGCEGPRDSVVVSITPKPSNPVVISTQSYCQGATVPQLTATGTNLKWYTTPFGGSELGFAPTPSSATPGNTTYYVSQTDAITGCESDRTAITITIHPTPAAPGVAPANYCVGGPSTPALNTFVTGSNITWYSVPSGGTGSSTVPVVNTSVAAIDTYYVSQTLNTCEGARSMLIVTVNDLPVPPITTDTSYCQFAASSQLSAVGNNLLWYTAATGGTGSATAPIPATNTAGTFKYYVSQTQLGCESMRDSVVVTIYAKPTAPIGNDDSICQFSMPVSLTATGSNLLWYVNATGGIGSNVAPQPSTFTPGTYYWYVSQSMNSCESERDTITIEIVPQPQQPEGDSAEFCLNGPSDTLTATGQNLLWYTVPTGGVGVASAPVPSTSIIGTRLYYVSQTINGCESKRDTVTVKVDTLVTATITLSDTVFCLYDTIEVGQIGLMPDTSLFIWTWSGGKVLSGDSSGPYIIKWDTAGTKTIILSADNNGCRAADTTSVEVLPLPEVYFNMIPEVCIGIDVHMEVDSVLKNAATFVWTFDSLNTTIIGVDSNKYTAKWSTPGQKVVSLYTVSDSGCISSVVYDTINVRDYPRPVIEKLENSTVCTKSEILLKTASLTGGLYKYEWSPAESFLTNKSSEAIAKVSSSGYVKVRVTDEYGCSGEDSTYVAIKLCCKVVLPSAFSPNGDGRNDKFGIISNGNYRIISFKVVNRYGQEVFSTNNQNDRWDGMFNGSQQGLGTYNYYIKYTCQDDDADHEVEERGNVILVR